MQQSISSLWLQKLYLDLVEVQNVKYKSVIMVGLKSDSQKNQKVWILRKKISYVDIGDFS